MKRLGTLACLIALLLVPGRDSCRAQNPDPHAAEKYGFAFRNFTDKSYSWDIFSHSFFGVPLDSNLAWATATFDKAFYELAFKTKLPDPAGTGNGAGNCWGISLQSIMMNKFGGYYGYCAPTGAYKGDTSWSNAMGPNDPALRRVINIMMGRQLSLAALESYLDQALSGHSQDCNYGFKLAQQTIGKEGPCLVCITNAQNPADGSGGHTLIAYGVTENPTGMGHIWVVDPNRLWAVPTGRDRGWYQGDSNHIDCNLGTNKWSFLMKGSPEETWPTGSGNLIIIPASLVGPPGRSPSSMGLAIGELLNKLLLTDAAEDNLQEEFLRHRPSPPDIGEHAER